MILNGVVTPGQQPGLPWLVWLHGFLGSAGEWQSLVPGFRPWPQLCIDLPGHGGSATCRVADFAAVDGALRETLEYYGIRRYWLIGYSLGGRIAMYHACQGDHPGLCGLVVEGGNPGLSLREERLARQASDDEWARRLLAQPLPQVLDDWYRQPVFATLTDDQRRALVALRSNNNPRTLAAMLSATSLGRQPDLSAALAQLALPFYYLCGERDSKFRAIGEGLSATTLILSQTGHNGHRENPAAFAQCLHDLLCHPTQGPTHDLS